MTNPDSKNKWERIGTARRAGILVPLFSVYSRNSIGIGDLDDMKLIVDLCAKTGNSILQLLPMNEVGSTYCPYDAVSSFALEPAYISLNTLPVASDKSLKAKIGAIKKRFPAGKAHVDYGIKGAKIDLLRDVYLANGRPGPKEFKKFVEENRYWIDDFALFRVLKDHHKGLPWYEWEGRFRDRDHGELDAFETGHEDEIEFQKWMQWLAYSQFRDAKARAASKKVLMKGDLPILISRDSADVWAHPEFFKLGFAAGAPPDMYCAKGQRWGMPTYDWARIADGGYRYLKEKLRYAENFYDMLRVDHVAGLFRIWSIPYDEPAENQGLNGVFDPRDENEWEEHGKRILDVMNEGTAMLLSAEDLGIIPKVCPQTLKSFGIPGNDVQRWVKDWKVKHDFLKPDEYRHLAVAMLSTHDTTNWAAWWENEAGTADEALFIRKCSDHRRIDYEKAKPRLFDPALSRHGRLRWLKDVSSADHLAGALGKRKEELADFIDIYENTYLEKEKLWKQLNINGPMREKSDRQILGAALRITLSSGSVFSIELLTDYLLFAGMLKGDPYQYRINFPGTISDSNWSLVMPISLEELLNHKASNEIRELIAGAGRI